MKQYRNVLEINLKVEFNHLKPAIYLVDIIFSLSSCSKASDTHKMHINYTLPGGRRGEDQGPIHSLWKSHGFEGASLLLACSSPKGKHKAHGMKEYTVPVCRWRWRRQRGGIKKQMKAREKKGVVVGKEE